MDMKFEVAILPVSDIDRTKLFYKALGWREDADFVREGGFRVVQLTPPGSQASVIFGSPIAAGGTERGLHMLVVDDVAAARAELVGLGVEVSEVFHDLDGVFHHHGSPSRAPGRSPEGNSYGSFVTFSDPDGNDWVVQEVTKRLPGRVSGAVYGSATDLEAALMRVAAAHGEHEAATGQADPDWPGWYARFMVGEQS